MWNAASLRIFALRSAYENPLKELIEGNKIYPEDVSLMTYFDTAEEVLDMKKDYNETQRVQNATLTSDEHINFLIVATLCVCNVFMIQ